MYPTARLSEKLLLFELTACLEHQLIRYRISETSIKNTSCCIVFLILKWLVILTNVQLFSTTVLQNVSFQCQPYSCLVLVYVTKINTRHCSCSAHSKRKKLCIILELGLQFGNTSACVTRRWSSLTMACSTFSSLNNIGKSSCKPSYSISSSTLPLQSIRLIALMTLWFL